MKYNLKNKFKDFQNKRSLKISKRQSKQTYNFTNYKENKDIKIEIEKRYNILNVIVILALLILVVGLFLIQVVGKEKYSLKLENLTKTVIYGETAPRGRIYDRNGKLIVDNIPSKVIYYKKPSGITTKEEIKIAYKLAPMIELDFNKLNDYDYKVFWIKNHEDKAKEKITNEEWQKLEERKLTSDDIYELKIERVTIEDLSEYNDLDKKAAYIYTLMNTGYSYDEKVIKNENVTDEEYALVSENISELKGVNTKLDWERSYIYGDTFRSILGNVSSSKSGIPAELKDYYLKKGYSLDDRVGTSNLEYQYEDILRGKKNKYEVMNDGSYKLIEEGKRGNDIVLTIDIELQKALEEILTEEVLNTKKEANTEFYDGSFVIISDPKTGEILAMAGKKLKQNDDGTYSVIDFTSGITQSTAVMGSVVKGASHIVGYNTGAITPGEYQVDECIKIAGTQKKCSWRTLGRINDIDALALSSNVYQFKTAMKVAGANYEYNKPLVINEGAFDIYRNTFKEFGLGVKTEIDLPVESLGYTSDNKAPGLLLDFVMGQYDTYTPIQLSQYISTFANGGNRLQPHLLKEVRASTDDETLGDVIYTFETNILNGINTTSEYLNRVKEGFYAVMNTSYGLGREYIADNYDPSGKTGTSQSAADTNGDGINDTDTVSTAFVGYAPSTNPKISITVTSPNSTWENPRNSYSTLVTRRISRRASDVYFSMYPLS